MTAFQSTFSHEHQARARQHGVVVRRVPDRPTGKHGRAFDRDLVERLARDAASCAEILFQLNVSRDSWYFRTLAFTAWTFAIALPVNTGRPGDVPAWRNTAALRAAFAANDSMHGVCEHFGVSSAGATHARIRRSAAARGVNLPEWARTRTS